jgi:acetyl/propionyl-CoA carboxylase alpha subunit
MRRALTEFLVSGVDTTVPFHLWALDQPDFAAGDYDVRFTDRWGNGPRTDDVVRRAVVAAAAWAERRSQTPALPTDGASPAWIAAAREEGLR